MKVYIYPGGATHFLEFEKRHIEKNWELVSSPSSEAVLYVLGPPSHNCVGDGIGSSPFIPALRRVLRFLPGYGCDPVHCPQIRAECASLFSRFDLVFIDPGIIYDIFKDHKKVVKTLPCIDSDRVFFKQRTKICSLLHASSPGYPQKDEYRSKQIMQSTGMKWEMFPDRSLGTGIYLPYSDFRDAYIRHDGFVHIASDVNICPFIDGMYVTCLLDAGASGAICFWHNTFNVQDYVLETVYDLPLEISVAAEKIKEIAKNINVSKHSQATSEEIRDKFDSYKSFKFRHEEMLKLLSRPPSPFARRFFLLQQLLFNKK